MPSLTLRIEPNSKSFLVEIDDTTTIKELFEYLQPEIQGSQGQNNSNNQSYQQWTCCITQENRFLQLNDRVPHYTCELLINTQPNPLNTVAPQSNGQQQNNQHSYQNTPTYQQPSYQQLENIDLRITIQDGNQNRILNVTLSSNSTLENVAQSVLIFCGLKEQVAAVDLELFNNQYNKPEKRNKTLGQLQIKTNTQLNARIRWIGG